MLAAASAAAGPDEDAKLSDAIQVLRQIMAIPETGIPPALLGNSQGVAIIPEVVKVGFVIGGRFGKGVVSVKDENGEWSDPCFASITAGSIGWQIGAQSSDLILVFKTRKSVEGMVSGKFTLGADVAVAAGPVGRQAAAATDAEIGAEIYSYSRSRGLFAGVSLEGSALEIDGAANGAFYGEPGISAADIFAGEAAGLPAGAARLKKLLRQYASGA